MKAGSARAVRWAGDILITLGIVVVLLIAYQLWWTNISAANAAESERAALTAQWAATGTVTPSPQPTASPATPSSAPTPAPSAEPSTSPVVEPVAQPEVGRPFALMYIPRLKDSVWGTPVLEGTSLDELAKGIGHYVGTALPGEIGNFATAAHRATHGEPFRDFDQLRKGDQVIVETKGGWFVYELDKDRIVTPTDVWVIEPVPGEPDATPTEALITLTTCNPRWASTERWVWWGYLVEERTREQGPPAALQAKG